ncbi:MAG: hypothetical protein LBB90_11450, partial [Tannerella sp.]|nr:hypothetical protein [Tannerella sp.]
PPKIGLPACLFLLFVFRFALKAAAKVDTFSFLTNFFNDFLCYKIYILSQPIPHINTSNSFFLNDNRIIQAFCSVLRTFATELLLG